MSLDAWVNWLNGKVKRKSRRCERAVCLILQERFHVAPLELEIREESICYKYVAPPGEWRLVNA